MVSNQVHSSLTVSLTFALSYIHSCSTGRRLPSMLIFVEFQIFSERCNVFICLNERVGSVLMVGHEALGKTQNRNTLMLLSLNKVDTGFLKGLCLHTSAR